ncbi:MAG TPA: VWA domain-containing protein [Thermoanaerobaculia bacterium]|nr:VWA domain-containing protein [Thermoanaerobaculia bacterium]
MSGRRFAVLLTAYLLGSGVSAFAQDAASSPDTPDNPFGEEVAVNYVMIPFTVLGSKGAPIIDLKSKEVSLLVDGRPVPSDMFEVSMNAPVSWTILLDGSGSMGLAGKMDAARAAVSTLMAHRQPGDDFSLYVFAEGKATEIVEFTEDPLKITRAMKNVKPWGKTAFFDALADMPERSSLGKNPTRAIILLSDGIDNASHLTRDAIAHQLEDVAIPIYVLGLREPAEARPQIAVNEELSDIALLEELASRTGGKLYLGNQPDQLGTAMNGIESNLRAQYLIGFAPTGKGSVKYRRISLELAGRVRSVRVRSGYRGTEPPVLNAATREKPKRNERKRS